MARLLAFLALLFAVPALAQADGRLVDWQAMPSLHVEPRNITIWLPPGYVADRRRYPVIYMHDGQNIFVAGHAYGGLELGVDEALSQMMAVGQTRGAIVVGIWNTPLRGREYLPSGWLTHLPADTRARNETFHGGPSLADAYLRFLIGELKPPIDRDFRTKRDRRNTSIMGSSMGGLISLYALGEYPHIFGSAAALSIHWPLANPVEATPDEPRLVIDAVDQWLAASRIDPARNGLYIDTGTVNLDASYAPYADRFRPLMVARGWFPGCRARERVIGGDDHNEASWRARIDQPLAFLLTRC